jgi:hypothetical protein
MEKSVPMALPKQNNLVWPLFVIDANHFHSNFVKDMGCNNQTIRFRNQDDHYMSQSWEQETNYFVYTTFLEFV